MALLGSWLQLSEICAIISSLARPLWCVYRQYADLLKGLGMHEPSRTFHPSHVISVSYRLMIML